MKKEMFIYKKMMKKCFALAKNGYGKVSPNPLVGAIVLDESENIAGFGFHEKFGCAHAEVNALNMAKEKAKNGTLIVNLEPCSHFGKTPPCCNLIVEKGIKKVVIGCIDPNPKVAGKGIEYLKNNNVEVFMNVLENQAKKLNEIFFTNILHQKTFVAIKTATTLDGKIATKDGISKWITSSRSRKKVQKLRNIYDSILTSSNTVLQDNPSLTCRMKNGRNPIRIILDSHLKTPFTSKVYSDDGTKVLIFTVEKKFDEEKYQNPNLKIVTTPDKNGKIDLNFVFDFLFKNDIKSTLVEAGAILNGEIVKLGLCDKLYHFVAPKLIGDENAKNWAQGCIVKDLNNLFNFKIEKTQFLNPDLYIEAYFDKQLNNQL